MNFLSFYFTPYKKDNWRFSSQNDVERSALNHSQLGRLNGLVENVNRNDMINQDKVRNALRDRYTFLDVLGKGAIGTVYRARDAITERLVAIKVLNVDDTAARERFRTETRALFRLRHPNIISFEKANEVDGIPYYVQEYVEGESLEGVLDRVERLTLEQAIEVTAAVARALQYAHSFDILHRDIKPSNVLIPRGPGGLEFSGAKLVDFGVLGMLRADTGTTVIGQVFGTPLYMSPEQLLGRPQDVRADVYGLGALLFTMLVGYPPFRDDKASNTDRLQQLHRLISEPVVIPPSLPSPIIGFLTRALAKRPEDRPADIVSAIKLLGRAVSGEHELGTTVVVRPRDTTPPRVRPLPRPSSPPQAPPRRIRLWVAAAGVISVSALLWTTNSWEWPASLDYRSILGILVGILLIIGGLTIAAFLRRWLLASKSRIDGDISEILARTSSRVAT